MHDYRIEKSRYPVVVTTRSGERLTGDMFVQAYAPHRTGPEEPADILNDPEPFFPLMERGGEILLIAKDNVLEVETVAAPHDDDDVRETIGRPTLIEVMLAGGHARIGELLLEVSPSRSRLLDYLNHFNLRFLPLRSGEGIRHVNRRLLERVRPID